MANEELKKKNWHELNGTVRVVVEAANYKFEDDNRAVIPFVCGLKWGAMNNKGEVIIPPRYDFVIIDPLTNSGLVRVGIIRSFENDNMTRDTAPYYRYKVGLFDTMGTKVLDVNYQGVIISQDGKILSVQNMKGEYGVLNLKGEIIVPFGRYSYIDGFDNGLARVKLGQRTNGVLNSENKWGLINEEGKEVLPVVFDNIWKFYRKNRFSTRVERDGTSQIVYFRDLDSSQHSQIHCLQDNDYHDDYNSHYGEYAGSYAQDVMGFSDEDIDDAFDGEPDAYWNID